MKCSIVKWNAYICIAMWNVLHWSTLLSAWNKSFQTINLNFFTNNLQYLSWNNHEHIYSDSSLSETSWEHDFSTVRKLSYTKIDCYFASHLMHYFQSEPVCESSTYWWYYLRYTQKTKNLIPRYILLCCHHTQVELLTTICVVANWFYEF